MVRPSELDFLEGEVLFTSSCELDLGQNLCQTMRVGFDPSAHSALRESLSWVSFDRYGYSQRTCKRTSKLKQNADPFCGQCMQWVCH